tara:strand:- start:175 stop:369 length:195 start_codon:yes stop_codon:yes gene_type:complete
MNNKENLEQEANVIRQRIEKLDEQIHGIELCEAVTFFEDFAKDLNQDRLPVSADQINFSQAAWR